MKFFSQLFMQRSTNQPFNRIIGKPHHLCVGTLVMMCGMEIVSPAAFSQSSPSSIKIAQTLSGLGSDNFNPGLQSPQPKLTVPVAPSFVPPAAPQPSTKPEPAPSSPISTPEILDSNNFNPALQLPPPKTEALPLPSESPKPKPSLPQPETVKASSPPIIVDTVTKIPGRARSGASWVIANPPQPSPSTAPPSEPAAATKPESSSSGPSWLKPAPSTAPKPEAPTASKPEPATSGPSWLKPAPSIAPKPEAPTASKPASSTSTPSWLKPAQPTTSKPETAQGNPAKPESSGQKPGLAKGPVIILESVVPDFRSTENESGQINRSTEATLNFLLENGDRIKLRSGFNTYIKPKFPTITNIPINLSWETKVGALKLEPSIGIDLFDKAPSTMNYGLKLSTPISENMTLSGAFEYGSYKFNSESIKNQVSALRFGPGLFWQVDKNMSFLLNYKYGIYNDKNTENQLFSRLEYKAGQLWLAANVFSWSFGENIGAARGYFSPPSFLAYNAEIGVEGPVLVDSLTCKLSTQIGNQDNNGQSTVGNSYQIACKAKLSPSLEASFGYGFGNSRKDYSSEELGRTITLNGGLRYKF